MSFEEEFDRKINQKMNEASFPFDEANWAKASSMIDAERKAAATGASKFYIPALFIGLVSLSVLSFIYFNKEDKAIALEDTYQNELTNQKTVSTELETAIVAKEKPTTNSDVNYPAIQQNINSGSQQAISSGIEAELETKKPLTENKSDKNKVNKEPNKESNNAVVFATPDLEAGSEKQSTELTVNTNNADTKAESTQTTDASINNASEPARPKFKHNAPPAHISYHDAEEEVIDSVLMNVALNEVSEEKTITSDQLTLKQLNLSTNEFEMLSMPFVLLPRYDDDYYKKTNKHLSHFMNIEAGGQYNLGWMSEGKKDAQGFNWFGGLNYGYYLTKKIALGIGFQAFNISHINQPFYQATSKQYNFGSTSASTVITSNQIYFAAIPVKIYYSLTNKNKLGLGFTTAYAFNAVNSVNTYSETQETLRTDLPLQQTKGIYKESTNQYNYLLSAFYKLQLSKRVALNAEYIISLTDIFKNTTTIKQNEKPQGLRLSINYTLFEK